MTRKNIIIKGSYSANVEADGLEFELVLIKYIICTFDDKLVRHVSLKYNRLRNDKILRQKKLRSPHKNALE